MDKTNFRYLSINFLATWYITVLLTFFFSILLLTYLSTAQTIKPVVHTFKLYSALPQTTISTEDSIEKQDGRAKIVEDFFKGYRSVLANYSDLFINVADKYSLDYRLLPAISMQESNGGKRVIKNSFNPFGYGIYGGKAIYFNSWEEAIERVGRGLREDYLRLGLTTPDKIMAKYTPPALADGSWARGVNTFMEELR